MHMHTHTVCTNAMWWMFIISFWLISILKLREDESILHFDELGISSAINSRDWNSLYANYTGITKFTHFEGIKLDANCGGNF